MEGAFKFLFFLAILVFCLVVIGVFLVIIKVILLFQPQVYLMGVLMS